MSTVQSRNRLHELPPALREWLAPFYTPPMLVLCVMTLETALCAVIIRKVAYTEIDWTTYMQQVGLYLKGERDYARLKGDTGPLVYPAGHVYVYSALHALTDGGRDIRLAQGIFAGVYLLTQGLVVRLTLKARNIPLYAIPLVTLSKRLHSIYLLRLFNDGIAMVPLYFAVLLASRRRWRSAAVLYSLALSVKMNMLLYAPALALLITLDQGLAEAVTFGLATVLAQILLGLPFLLFNPSAYLSRAFDLSRAFLYRWTVNWRFVPEDTFLSRPFAFSLLFTHLSLLLLIALRLCTPHGGLVRVAQRALRSPARPAGLASLSQRTIVTTLFVSNLIGITCARSLHYQFYAWYAPQLVYLAWQTSLPSPIKVALLLAIEYAWNTFPSTRTSSLVLLIAHGSLIAALLWQTGGTNKAREQSEM